MAKWLKNEGCYPRIGFNWFINGIDDNVQESAKGQGGLFRDVFGDNALVNFLVSSNRRSFNQFVQEALKNHRMITIDEFNMAGAHAIACWGFEFDDEGYVCALLSAVKSYMEKYPSFVSTPTTREPNYGSLISNHTLRALNRSNSLLSMKMKSIMTCKVVE